MRTSEDTTDMQAIVQDVYGDADVTSRLVPLTPQSQLDFEPGGEYIFTADRPPQCLQTLVR